MKQRIMISLAPFFLSSCLTAYAGSQLKQEPVLHHNDLPINYVEPSSQVILKTEEKIKDLFNLQYDNEYTIQKIGTQTYWIGVQYYNATVIINDEGVLVIDPLGPDSAKALFNAITSITDKPITAIIYSHYHLDHIGGTNTLIALNNKKYPNNAKHHIRIIANKQINDNIKQYASLSNNGSRIPKVPLPTETFSKSMKTIHFGKQQLILKRLKGAGHTKDNTLILLPEERVIHFADMINPDQLPFYNFAGAEHFPHGYIRDLNYLVSDKFSTKWDFINGGHGNIGTKTDIQKLLDYIHDLTKATKEALNSADYPTNKADGNHFIWFKHWQNTITKQVKERLRNKYSHMYGFDAGVVESHAAMVLNELMDH